MNDKTIFTFWEPKNQVPGYLRLCMKTWAKKLPRYDIIVLDHSNLNNYIDEDAFDIPTLKKLAYMSQKDAFMVAVMNKFGGIFMDADTIITGDIAPIVSNLRRTEIVLFSRHLAFMAARPRAKILTLWQAGIQERLRQLKRDEEGKIEPQWDFVGNSVLKDTMTDLITESRWGRAYERVHRSLALKASWPGKIWHRIADPIWRMRRGFILLPHYRKHIVMLSKNKYGFIAEKVHYRYSRLGPQEQYRRYWFESNVKTEKTFCKKRQRVIGLHNSWTPDWFKELPEEEVLKQNCLLSRVLRHTLAA
jgi:capsular polysaccharide synthesis protein